MMDDLPPLALAGLGLCSAYIAQAPYPDRGKPYRLCAADHRRSSSMIRGGMLVCESMAKRGYEPGIRYYFGETKKSQNKWGDTWMA